MYVAPCVVSKIREAQWHRPGQVITFTGKQESYQNLEYARFLYFVGSEDCQKLSILVDIFSVIVVFFCFRAQL